MRVFLRNSDKKPQHWIWGLCVIGGAVGGCQDAQKPALARSQECWICGAAAIPGEMTQSVTENKIKGLMWGIEN